MPGLVPAIHVGRPARLSPLTARCRKTWMPGTSPGMTFGGRRRGKCQSAGIRVPSPPIRRIGTRIAARRYVAVRRPAPPVISTGARSAERRNLFARAFRQRSGQISPLRRPFGPAPVEMTRGRRPPEVLTGQQWTRSGHDGGNAGQPYPDERLARPGGVRSHRRHRDGACGSNPASGRACRRCALSAGRASSPPERTGRHR